MVILNSESSDIYKTNKTQKNITTHSIIDAMKNPSNKFSNINIINIESNTDIIVRNIVVFFIF